MARRLPTAFSKGITMAEDKTHIVEDLATLEAIYGTPAPTSTVKEVDYLHPHYRAFIAAAPFATQVESNQKYADFDVVLMEDVGHYLHMTHPDEFNALLLEALGQLTAQ